MNEPMITYTFAGVTGPTSIWWLGDDGKMYHKTVSIGRDYALPQYEQYKK